MGVTADLQDAPQPDFDDKLAVEIRGYELAKLIDKTWVQVAAYRPNTYGFNEMMSAWKNLHRLHPNVQYDGRAIVSIKLPRADQVDQKENTNG
jgi:hypothetical protein